MIYHPRQHFYPRSWLIIAVTIAFHLVQPCGGARQVWASEHEVPRRSENSDLELATDQLHLKLEETAEGLSRTGLRDLRTGEELIDPSNSTEGEIVVEEQRFIVGGNQPHSFRMVERRTARRPQFAEMRLVFSSPESFPGDALLTIVYRIHEEVPVLVRWMRIENMGDRAFRVDRMILARLKPRLGDKSALLVWDDFVRHGLQIDGQPLRSPHIENVRNLADQILTPSEASITIGYPEQLDRWLLPGDVFSSFRSYELAAVNRNDETRSLSFRAATRQLYPETRKRWLSIALAPVSNVEEYYSAIDEAAKAGYEAVVLHHGWIDGQMVSPLFTNYADYELRPELFPSGWTDVRRLTDHAHRLGLKISFYTTYATVWHGDQSAVGKANRWQLVWAPDDKSQRWGYTHCPASDWAPYVHEKIEKTLKLGGFDGYLLDGPYYGDVCIHEEHAHAAGGSSQALAWQQLSGFYQRMCAQGFHGEAAQGLCAMAHGTQRVTTSGYDEGEFATLGPLAQVLATRKGAYHFTRLYRPEQGIYFIPVVPWLHGSGLEPMEENVTALNAYLANCFGYGFDGRCFTRRPWDGPKSRQFVLRWLDFWKRHEDYFRQGHLVHVAEPDGRKCDAVLHAIPGLPGNVPISKALLVVYNPSSAPLAETFDLTQLDLKFSPGTWRWTEEDGTIGHSSSDDLRLVVRVPPQDATWVELVVGDNATGTQRSAAE
jgi:hypothetical protein